LPPDQRANPNPDHNFAGTSDFTEWLMGEGIDNAAKKWRELRQPKMVWVARIRETEGEQVYATAEAAAPRLVKLGCPRLSGQRGTGEQF
jgi:hypothetical protein